jgi:ribosomal subunit interface protein
MKIILSGKNMKLDEPLKVFVDDKIGGLAKYIAGDAVEARVEIGLPSKHHRSGQIYYAEVNLKVGGKLLRATAENEDMRTAIVEVRNELHAQLKKFKDKKRDSLRGIK